VPNLLFNLQKTSKIFSLKFVLRSLLRNCGEKEQASNLVQKSPQEGKQEGCRCRRVVVQHIRGNLFHSCPLHHFQYYSHTYKKNTYTSSKSISLIEVSVENDSSARKQACVVYVSEYLGKQIGRRFYLFRAKISLFGFEFWHGSSRRRIIEIIGAR
jgi:hypothetical protein